MFDAKDHLTEITFYPNRKSASDFKKAFFEAINCFLRKEIAHPA